VNELMQYISPQAFNIVSLLTLTQQSENSVSKFSLVLCFLFVYAVFVTVYV